MIGLYSKEEQEEAKVRLLKNKAMNAARAGIPFDLKVEDLVWPQYCPVLGIELSYERKGSGEVHDNSATFDRLDPNKGYVRGNVFIISYRANRIKNDGSAEEHRRIAAYIEERS